MICRALGSSPFLSTLLEPPTIFPPPSASSGPSALSFIILVAVSILTTVWQRSISADEP